MLAVLVPADPWFKQSSFSRKIAQRLGAIRENRDQAPWFTKKGNLMKPTYASLNGYLTPKGFPIAALKSALDYQARPDDVFICTYPKCGTTWVQNIVYLMMNRGEPLPSHRSMTEAIPHLEEVGREVVEMLPEPRCIKTHLPFPMTPFSDNSRYVCVARNPFDCVVSFFHHTRGFEQHYDFADGLFEDYFECFLAGEVDSGDYFEHLLGWHEQHQRSNVLFLTYEELKKNTASEVTRLGEFLGPPWRDSVRDEELLERVLHHSSFSSMAKDQGRWASERPKDMPNFIRKGKVGDWTNHFSAEQAHRLVERFDQATQGTALANWWPEVLRAPRSL